MFTLIRKDGTQADDPPNGKWQSSTMDIATELRAYNHTFGLLKEDLLMR